ncbi:MAG TPA: GGDEF domain-containing protein [Halothiobacillaceae bacterium]|nr:GGDEF domain-containing protein [Halothiobacillaceae bacterium]
MAELISLQGVSLSILYLTESINEAVALRGQLRNAGLAAKVEHAADINAAKKMLNNDQVDVVYIDVKSGLQNQLQSLCDHQAHQRELNRWVPIVVFSTGKAETLNKLYAIGAFCVITDEELTEIMLIRAAQTSMLNRRFLEQKKLLEGAERRCEKLIDGSAEPVAYVHDGLHIYANQAYVDMMGFATLAELENEPILDLVEAGSAQDLKQFLRQPGARARFNFRGAREESFELELHSSMASYEGEPCLQLFAKEIKHEDEAVSEQLEYLSRRDLLTGLYNRNYLFERMAERVGSIRAQGSGHAILALLEITNHERTKELVGTTGMDDVLTEFGKQIEAALPENAVVARHGAFSFLIFQEEGEASEASALTKMLVDVAREYVYTKDTTSITLKTAIGYLIADENSPDQPSDLVHRVERAGLEAAKEGVHVVREYQPDLKTASEREQEEAWARRIKKALKESRFTLVYQPIVPLTGDTSRERFEVFIRMLDEYGEQISPAEFMEQARRTGLIQSIDRWVLLSAIKQIQKGIKLGRERQLYIRISEESLKDTEFTQWLISRLAMTRLPEDRLVIQVSTTVAGHMLRHLADLHDGLAPLGGTLIVDDFGDNDEAFQIFDHLKVAQVKLSPALLEEFSNETERQEQVGRIIEQLKNRNLKVIVPNVEDAITLQLLWPMGVDFAQGEFIEGVKEEPELQAV